MQYFSVKGFSEFQHYKDRSPPWIKLYNKLLDDYEFGALPDASKAHLVAIWLLASRYENRIPLDPQWIARRINATNDVDLHLLSKSGFIILEQDCSETLADCKQPACPEREGETETETETEKKAVAPPAKRGARLPADWFPTPDEIQSLKTGSDKFTDAEIFGEIDDFRDYWIAIPGNRGCKLDWLATYRTRLRRQREYRSRNQAPAAGQRVGQRQGGGGLVGAGLRRAAEICELADAERGGSRGRFDPVADGDSEAGDGARLVEGQGHHGSPDGEDGEAFGRRLLDGTGR